MRSLMRMVAAASVAATVVLSGVAPAASAAESTKRPPVPVASVAGLPLPRLDQDTISTVVARGASRAAAVSVSWGEGSTRTSDRSPCAVARAVQSPESCVVTLSHRYTSTGTFPIVVRSGARVIARASVVVRPAARPWAPPPGFVQSTGWAFFGGGATYVPCATVPWYYDRNGEPAAAAGMRSEIEAGLARLRAETGLDFVEVADPAAARLRFGWGDLSVRYPGAGEAAGVGGRRGSAGFVQFSTTHWWPTDAWSGFAVVTQPDGSYAVGRGWLVVHESMHALGLDHVDDPTAIMHPYAGATAFNAGDLEGLRTMYLNNPCPT